MPAKSKASAKVDAKAKRAAIALIWKTLDRIRERDGVKIFKEAADRLLDSIEIARKKRVDRGQRIRRGDRLAAAAPQEKGPITRPTTAAH